MASLKGNCSKLAYTSVKGCDFDMRIRLSPQQESRLSIMRSKSLFYNFTQNKIDSVSKYLKDKRNY